jgi:hypothetical protein
MYTTIHTLGCYIDFFPLKKKLKSSTCNAYTSVNFVMCFGKKILYIKGVFWLAYVQRITVLLMHALKLNCERGKKGKGNWPSQGPFSLVFTVLSNDQTRQDRMDRSSVSEVSHQKAQKVTEERRSMMHKSYRKLCRDKRNTLSSGIYDWLDAHLWTKKRKKEEQFMHSNQKKFEQFPDGVLHKDHPHSHRDKEGLVSYFF